MKEPLYSIIDGKVVEVIVVNHFLDEERVMVIYDDDKQLLYKKMPAKDIYFNRETPERILAERRMAR